MLHMCKVNVEISYICTSVFSGFTADYLYLIEAAWHHYESVNQAILGPNNCFRQSGGKPLSEPMLACYQLDPMEHISFKSYLKIKVFIPENAFENIVCNMMANCLGLEVLTGQVRLWSTFWLSPHLYRRWFMSSIYECDLKRSMCVNKIRTTKVFMPSVTQFWFWNVHHHHLYLKQRWVNVLSLLDHQLCILQLIL